MPSRPTSPVDSGAIQAQLLLTWWEAHGRHAIPWKLRADGAHPEPGEALDPYGVWVAEVMRAARQHSWLRSPGAALERFCTRHGGRAVAQRGMDVWLVLWWSRLVVHFRPSGRS